VESAHLLKGYIDPAAQVLVVVLDENLPIQ
jgi:hypothetical protein